MSFIGRNADKLAHWTKLTSFLEDNRSLDINLDKLDIQSKLPYFLLQVTEIALNIVFGGFGVFWVCVGCCGWSGVNSSQPYYTLPPALDLFGGGLL